MRLIWQPSAVHDLRRLQAFIAPKNPKAAQNAVASIRASLKMLERFPNLGRSTGNQLANVREWTINFGSGAYIARYQVKASAVVIIAIRHGLESDDPNDSSLQ
jgi:plasmid stabilization system protein ParE